MATTTSGPEGIDAKTSAPTTADERERRAHREVDPPGDDDQQLGQREHGDDRRLAEDVADVAGAQEDRRQGRDDHHDRDQHQGGPDADGARGRSWGRRTGGWPASPCSPVLSSAIRSLRRSVRVAVRRTVGHKIDPMSRPPNQALAERLAPDRPERGVSARSLPAVRTSIRCIGDRDHDRQPADLGGDARHPLPHLPRAGRLGRDESGPGLLGRLRGAAHRRRRRAEGHGFAFTIGRGNESRSRRSPRCGPRRRPAPSSRARRPRRALRAS